MIAEEEIRKILLAGLPGAEIEVHDMTGTLDHFEIRVASSAFAGKPRIEQHRMVFALLEKEMDKRIHAVQLKTAAI